MQTQAFAPDALIFDIDGVLINVEKSFPELIRLSVMEGWEKFCGGETDVSCYTKEHEKVLKLHGAFNDDFDIVWLLLCMAWATEKRQLSSAFPSPELLAHEIATFSGSVRSWAAERYRAKLPYDEVRAMCARRYMEELYKLETPMLTCHWKELPLPVAIYTGRNNAECLLAKKLLGWEDFPDELIIHSDSGITKPSPLGLEILCEKLGAGNPVFFGDTGSDIMASRAFGKGYFVAIGDLLADAEYRYDDPQEALEALLNFKVRGNVHERK